MNQLTLYALALRLWLEAIHPITPWLALSLGAWLVVYEWRKLLPGLWLKLETLDKSLSVALGALPSVIMTTAVGALTAGRDPWIVVGASLMGVAAPLFHHLLKALPIPYRGEPRTEPVKPPLTMLLLVLLCAGCGKNQPPPKYTADELLCIADAERVKLEDMQACEPCSDERIDVIMDKRKAAGRACYMGDE